MAVAPRITARALRSETSVSRAGFTLVELMAAVAVFGILLSIAVPSVYHSMDSMESRQNAESLSGRLRLARSQALSSYSDVVVYFNRDGDAFNVGETFAGLPYELGVDLSQEVTALTPPGMTTAQFAQRWILDQEAVSVVIPGASSPKQARGNAAVSDLPPLSPELHAHLANFYADKVRDHIRGPY